MLDNYEEKLKENISNYEIKTSSEDILKAYKASNKKTSRIKSKKKLFITLSSLFTSGILTEALLLTLLYINKDEENISDSNYICYPALPTKDYLNLLTSKDQNLVGFELSSLLNNNYDSSSINNLNNIRLLNSNNYTSISIDQNYFIKVVNNFDLAADSIKSLYDSTSNYSLLASEVSFSYNNEIFNIKTDIYNNNNIIYSLYINQTSYQIKNNKETWIYSGYINYFDSYYPFTLSKEIKNNELEIESKIVFDDYIAIVSKEIENDESEYEFEYMDLNNNPIYNYEIESNLNKDPGVEISIEDYKTNLEYEYITTIINNNKYSILLDDEDNDINFTFTLEFLTNKVYSKEGLNNIYK